MMCYIAKIMDDHGMIHTVEVEAKTEDAARREVRQAWPDQRLLHLIPTLWRST